MEAYITITNNCNMECRHCCFCAGPGKPSMPYEDVKKVIGNLPWDIEEIVLSGGEVFTRKRLLYSALEAIQDRGFRNLRETSVQTNGFWAKSKEAIERTLDELVGLGVNHVDVSSNSPYHKKSLFKTAKLSMLDTALYGKNLGAWRGYDSDYNVFPAGRARSLDKKHWTRRDRRAPSSACMSFAKKEFVAIDHESQIYPCCWMVHGTSIGDAREGRLADTVRKALKNGAVKTLTGEDGPITLAKEVGMSGKEIRRQMRYGLCGLCSYLFSEGIVKL